MTADLSRDLLIGMLRKGETGSQILQILDVIVSQESADETETVSA